MKITLMLLVSLSLFAFDAKKEFMTNCATCHSIGAGDVGKTGPDLAGVSKRRSMDWIVKFVQYPEGMIEGDAEEEGYEKPDPVAQALFKIYKTKMAEQELEEDQIKAIIAYIDSQGKKAHKDSKVHQVEKMLKTKKAAKKK